MKPATRAISTSVIGALRRLGSACCLIVAACCFLATTAEGHDPGLSSADLRIERGHLAAQLTFARADLVATIAQAGMDDQPTTAAEAAAREQLEELASSALEVEVDGGKIAADKVAVEIEGSRGAVHFRIEFPVEPGARLSVRSRLIGILPRGHRQYVSIKEVGGNLLGERMLDASSDTFEISLAATASATVARSFRQFLVLGVEHILTGYDHLVFLLGLIIAGAGFRAVAKIITSFTLAHSITLALATLDVVRISPGVVEPLIAASIVYVGLENIFRRDLRWRWLLTFGFGLVHGFGFASVLKELGIGAGGVSTAVPLVSFNLGVEMGQIAIAALALPLIWKFRERPSFVVRYAPACSVLITLAGAFWFIERTLLK
jgi:hydrogenase/urease accessory protein HupE